MATTRNNTAPWFVTPCILVGCHQGLGKACCFHLKSRTMQMEIFVSTHQTKECHSPEYSSFVILCSCGFHYQSYMPNPA